MNLDKSSVELSPSALTDPRAFGTEVLGPLYAEFFGRLEAFWRPGEHNVRRLFVARAGVRLNRLYQVWCTARGAEPAETEVLWASRLLVTKALYGVDDDLFHAQVLREFKDVPIAEFAKGMSRYSDEPLALGPLRKRPLKQLRRLLDAGKMPRLHAFLAAEAELAREYLKGRLGDASGTVFLVDSGWHGTMHRLLLPNTDADVFSLLVARVRRPAEEGPAGGQVTGLLLESDAFDPKKPESALVYHRHLIEAPLEPPIPSIERVVRDDAGNFSFPEADRAELVDEADTSDAMFLGVEDYLREHAARPLHARQTAFETAAEQLAQAILYPTEQVVDLLDMGARSSDFGRDYSAPVLMEPVSRRQNDAAHHRIEESLWPQGQAVVEYGERGARATHLDIAGRLTAADYFHPWRREQSEEDLERPSTTAVITRTKNRPVLLRRAAESVAGQTTGDYQWVVVNDGGDLDDVLEVVRSSRVPRSRITIVSNTSSVGMEAASNLGIAAVESDYVVIHDDDDSWDPRFLATTTTFLKERSRDYVGVITHTTYVSEEIVGDEVVIHKQRPHNGWLRSINLAEMAATNLFAPIAFVFGRDVYDKVGGFPEGLPVLGDWDFNLRVLTQGDIGVIPEPMAFYHHRDVGTSPGYGNSVLAGREKHIEYDAKVRNAMYRRIAQGDELGHLALIGHTLKNLREEVRRVQQPAPAAPQPRQQQGMDPDELWWALCSALHGPSATAAAGRFAKFVGRSDRTPERVSRQTISRLRRELDAARVPCPPDFDEDAYLAANPDVREAVVGAANSLGSGWEHYLRYGKAEGRGRPRKKRS